MDQSKKHFKGTRFSFGATSAIITTMGLIAGMDEWSHAKASMIGGIMIIALADNVSDSMGIHVFQESEHVNAKEVWISTFTNFASRCLVSLSFIAPIVLFPVKTAVVLSMGWGLLLLSGITYWIARERRKKPYAAILEHLGVALVVIFTSNLVGQWVSKWF